MKMKQSSSSSNLTGSGLRRLLGSLTLAALGLGAVPAAQAALVTGRFDPAFGATLNGVGYRGTATFQISDACLSLGGPTSTDTGAFIYAGYDCNGSSSSPSDAGMSFLGAEVEFYDLTNTSLILGTVSFLLDPTAVMGMYVQNNQVTGVQTGVIGAAFSTLPSSITPDPFFFLQFGIQGYNGTDVNENHGPVSPVPGDGDHDLDDMTADQFKVTTMFQQVGGCVPGGTPACTPSNPAATNFVPEPGSMPLVAGALAAAWWVRRRRRD